MKQSNVVDKSKQNSVGALQSKTILFNILSFIVVVLAGTTPVVDTMIKDPEMALNVKEGLAAVITLVNIFLRFRTDRPVEMRLK